MFNAIVNRTQHATTWQRIPWDDPDVSRRMLKEHLTQAHDAASRRTTIIDQQVAWIHEHVLRSRAWRILDLGCGPGLYTSRLAACGHTCVGIDFSPASIEYARQHNSTVTYVQADVRNADFGTDFDFAMMIFGEINTFTSEDTQHIIDKAFAALKPNGTLLLEPHTYVAVERIGHTAPTWFSLHEGLFSPLPHLWLQESFFHEGCATNRHYIIDAATGHTTEYASMLRAYTDDEYRHLLRQFASVTFYPTLANPADDMLCAIVARKA